MWARSTLALVAPSGSAAAAAQGRQLLAGEEEEVLRRRRWPSNVNGSDGMERAQEEQRGDRVRTHVNQAERKREPDVGMDVAKKHESGTVEGDL